MENSFVLYLSACPQMEINGYGNATVTKPMTSKEINVQIRQ